MNSDLFVLRLRRWRKSYAVLFCICGTNANVMHLNSDDKLFILNNIIG